MKVNFKTRKQKHINYVRNYIFEMHMQLSREVLDISDLSGRQLNAKVKVLKSKTQQMKKYKKYLNLLSF